jgi:hypothetical protein
MLGSFNKLFLPPSDASLSYGWIEYIMRHTGESHGGLQGDERREMTAHSDPPDAGGGGPYELVLHFLMAPDARARNGFEQANPVAVKLQCFGNQPILER